MMLKVSLCSILVAMVAGQACNPGENCDLPNCRCPDDTSIPGGLTPAETPQMVMVTFENAINEGNIQDYVDLFQVTNLNNCPVRGTFFVQTQFSDPATIASLYQDGYEIGANSFNDSFPADNDEADDWRAALQSVRQTLEAAGVAAGDIIGVRAPRLSAGGNNEFIGLGDNNFVYDATCASSRFVDENTFKWPYTYDFVPGPACDIGKSPDMPFEGKWQFLVADLEFNGTKCATPAACINVANQQDAFDLFYNSFAKHYEGNRSPFMIVINPEWVTVDYKKAGTLQFLEYIRAAFEDTWIITVAQALQWVQDPTPNSNITNFAPWQC